MKLNNRFFLTAFFVFVTYVAFGNTTKFIFNLWGDGANGSDVPDTAKVYAFLPDKENNTGRAVIICPGGDYASLNLQHEGTDWADFFNGQIVGNYSYKTITSSIVKVAYRYIPSFFEEDNKLIRQETENNFSMQFRMDNSDFLNKVLTRAFILLAGLVIAGTAICAIFIAVCPELQERFELGAKFSIILLPYMLLICIAAVFSAAATFSGLLGSTPLIR